MAYGVTSQRVLIISGSLSRKTKSLRLTAIPGVTLTERRNGEGDVVLDTRDMSHVAAGGWKPRGETVPDAFEFLPDARHVYEIVEQARRHALANPLPPETIDHSALRMLFNKPDGCHVSSNHLERTRGPKRQ